MNGYQQQITWLRRALSDTRPVVVDELLIPRTPAGELARSMAPDSGVVPREAAALLLFYPHEDELWLPLTVRSAWLPQHRGEVSLPGGATDPEDDGPVATALRETFEELGVQSSSIDVWGTLTPIYIPPSNFRLTPVVGFTVYPPELVPNPGEITDVFCVPLTILLDSATIVEEEWVLRGDRLRVPFFALQGYKVWGATALVLSELLARLRRATFLA